MNVETSEPHGNAACRLEAQPIARLRSRKDGAVIGLVYRWNTGETQTAWFGKAHRQFETEAIR